MHSKFGYKTAREYFLDNQSVRQSSGQARIPATQVDNVSYFEQ